MKKLFAAAALLFFLMRLGAAEYREIFRYPLGSQTMNAFMTAGQNLSRHPFVRGKFEQEKTLSRLNRVLKSGGNFIIAANLGMVWDTVSPFPSALALGSDFLIQSRPGGQRTAISAQGNETFLRLAEVISTVFSGNTGSLVDNFEVYFTGSASSWEMGLIPLDRAINIFADSIIMQGDSVIKTILILEQNGDSIKYILSNHEFPAVLSANEQAFFTIP